MSQHACYVLMPFDPKFNPVYGVIAQIAEGDLSP
jgi:hypothetical protein